MPSSILAEALPAEGGPVTQMERPQREHGMEHIWGNMATPLTYPDFPCPHCGLASGLLGISEFILEEKYTFVIKYALVSFIENTSTHSASSLTTCTPQWTGDDSG